VAARRRRPRGAVSRVRGVNAETERSTHGADLTHGSSRYPAPIRGRALSLLLVVLHRLDRPGRPTPSIPAAPPPAAALTEQVPALIEHLFDVVETGCVDVALGAEAVLFVDQRLDLRDDGLVVAHARRYPLRRRRTPWCGRR